MSTTGDSETLHEVLYKQSLLKGVGKSDCLSLEDKLLYGNPTRQVDVADFVGDTVPTAFFASMNAIVLNKF